MMPGSNPFVPNILIYTHKDISTMPNNLSQKLKKLRTENGYTQARLAEILNVTPQAISQLENGKTTLDIDKLVRLADLYHISTDELLGLTNDTEMDSIPHSNPEITKNQIMLEHIGLAVILILSLQVPFLSLITTAFVIVFLKKLNRKYWLIYGLCLLVLLFGCYTTFGFIAHFLTNYGTTSIQRI